jgi:hypothetical protein
VNELIDQQDLDNWRFGVLEIPVRMAQAFLGVLTELDHSQIVGFKLIS